MERDGFSTVEDVFCSKNKLADQGLAVAFTCAILSKSIYHKINLIFNKRENISIKFRLILQIQAIISSLKPFLAYFIVNLMDNPLDIMMNFAGLLVLTEIDNWAGMMFEMYLEAFHDDVINTEDYLVFKTDTKVRVGSYYHTMILIILNLALTVFTSITKYVVFCPNMDYLE